MNTAIVISFLLASSSLQEQESVYFATIHSPVENEAFAPDGVMSIRATFVDGNMEDRMVGKKPMVVITLIKGYEGGFVIHQSMTAEVCSVEEHDDRYALNCELSRRSPFSEGEYLLRVKFFVDGEEVITPSRMIKIVEPRADD